MAAHYDIALVGGGRLNLRLLKQLADTLSPHELQGKRILLVHNGPNPGGPAYDPELSPSPLPFHQAIGGIAKNGDFMPWLTENRERVVRFLEQANEGSRDWLEHRDSAGNISYRDYLTAGEYGQSTLTELRIPRAIYGLYLSDMLKGSLDTLTAAGAAVELVRGTAETLDSEKGQYRLRVTDGQRLRFPVTADNGDRLTWEKTGESFPAEPFTADNVCLGLGLMPNIAHPHVEGNPDYFPNLYLAGATVSEVTDAIRQKYADTGQPVSLLIEGAGPSAVDMVNWIVSQKLQDIVDVTVVTGSAHLRPAGVEPTKPGETFATDLTSYRADTAQALQEHTLSEIDRALTEGFSRPEAIAAIAPHIPTACQTLPEAEQAQFLEHQRRFYLDHLVFDAVETVNAWNTLQQIGKLHFISGHYVQPETARASGNTIRIDIRSLDGVTTRTLEHDLIVNCTGGQNKIIAAGHPLKPLIEQGLATPNAANTALTVDDSLQLRPGLYTAGYPIQNTGVAGIPAGLEAIGPWVDLSAKIIAGSMRERLQAKGQLAGVAQMAHIARGYGYV